MEIERINENTVKFYISYVDIESRGFEREEIWYNRERSEQLFWQMMDEVNYEEDFPVEGPLWIQVQALEKGLEIIVTKAQLNENSIGSLEAVEELIELTMSEQSKEEILQELSNADLGSNENDSIFDEDNSLITKFDDFEDLVTLSHYFKTEEEDQIETTLYHYKNAYYLYLKFETSENIDDADLLSQILEFSALDLDITSYVLDEYGETVMESKVFETIRQYF